MNPCVVKKQTAYRKLSHHLVQVTMTMTEITQYCSNEQDEEHITRFCNALDIADKEENVQLQTTKQNLLYYLSDPTRPYDACLLQMFCSFCKCKLYIKVLVIKLKRF